MYAATLRRNGVPARTQPASHGAAEIFEAVNRVDPRSSRATTYNNLRDLVQAGLVREVMNLDRYDVA